MQKFAVIQTRFETLPTEGLVEVLTEGGGMTHPDASRAARRFHGILGEHFSEQQAEAVCDNLADHGFGVRVVAADQLPDLPDPRSIRWCELKPDAFRIPEGIRGETLPIPWPSVHVVSAGQIAEVNERKVRDNKRPQNLFEKNAAFYSNEGPQYRKESELIDVIDVIGTDSLGELRYLRMPSHELSYGRIMGDATHLNRFERFVVIVEYLIEHACDAIISPQARKLLVSDEPMPRKIQGDGISLIQEESLQIYNRWLYSLSLHGLDESEEEDSDEARDD